MEGKRSRRGKECWKELSIAELTLRQSGRYGRIEILKKEIKELESLIEDKKN